MGKPPDFTTERYLRDLHEAGRAKRAPVAPVPEPEPVAPAPEPITDPPSP
jgi:hypothetical protein